jgi:hypothetical protein
MPEFPTVESLSAAIAATPDASPVQGPVTHPETGEVYHLGLHSTQVYDGRRAIRLAHGESWLPPKDGAPATVFRIRKET